jgi:hypothetical protein
VYGCLYTALTPEGAVAEFRKHLVRRGFDAPCDLVAFILRAERVFDLAGAIGFPHLVQTRATEPPGAGVVWSDSHVANRTANLGPELGSILLSRLVGNSASDLDACRALADHVRETSHVAIHAPSAAAPVQTVLALYPENRPAELSYGPDVLHRFALNHGRERITDAHGQLVRIPP